MADLPEPWREIRHEFEMSRQLDAEEQTPMLVFVDQLASGLLADRVNARVPRRGVLELWSLFRNTGDRKLDVRWDECHGFEVRLLAPKSRSATFPLHEEAVEVCSPEWIMTVVEDLVRELEGSQAINPPDPGWRGVEAIPGQEEPPRKFWFETEECWRTRPGDFAFCRLNLATLLERAWLITCRCVPAAMALWHCPCIQNLGEVFTPDLPSWESDWGRKAARLRGLANGLCSMGERCPSRLIWESTELLSLGDWGLYKLVDLDGEILPILDLIPDWIESHRGLAAALPTRFTLAAICKAAYHDVLGNPFRPVYPNPAWLAANDHAVEHLVREIDETGNFSRLGILADALTDAGCANDDLLDHCRTGGPHGPGCWVIDTLLGRM
jgi:hypothetical protein